jgi:DNA excision repair protein ERCC-6-like 2
MGEMTAIDGMVSSSAELENKHETTKCSATAKSYSAEQKKDEFSRIASSMGMSDLEFSKWLLAASPRQRSEVLQNYKRKKNRKYHHNHK